MVIYFYSNKKEEADAKLIHEQLKKIGVQMASAKYQQASLSDVDALILHGDTLDADANYFLALAIAENKPILVLLSKKISDRTVQTLEQNKNFQNKVKLVFYHQDNLVKEVLGFLKGLDEQAGREVSNIKYTLRISPKISEYLNWKTNQGKRQKADWLRGQLAKLMENDLEYQQHIENKFKLK